MPVQPAATGRVWARAFTLKKALRFIRMENGLQMVNFYTNMCLNEPASFKVCYLTMATL